MLDPDRSPGARRCGVLLPVAALPGPPAIGDFGPAAVAFADFLVAAGQSAWQVLPPTVSSAASGDSPYSALSAFALDPALASPDALVAAGWLAPGELDGGGSGGGRIAYREARRRKARWLAAARPGFLRDRAACRDLERFRQHAAGWLEDFALFRAARRQMRAAPWYEWPAELRDRQPAALAAARQALAPAIDHEVFVQYVLDAQWRRLRGALAERGIEALGDLPFYVAHDSADVWAHRHLFALDAAGRPLAVSGCPPDAYAPAGQLWGQPVYRWPAHREEAFAWWLARLARQLELFDRVRIDHFRGLVAVWEVPAGAAGAAAGAWRPAPGELLVERLRARWPERPFVAEDLGAITPEVEALRRRLAVPSTRVLQFAFGDDYPAGEHLPERVPHDCLLYTGTHDSNTLRGWLEDDLTAAQRDRLRDYLGEAAPAVEAAGELMRRCLASAARLVVLPVQDLLGLGSAARINRPGAARGQWRWRAPAGRLNASLAAALRQRTAASGRLPGSGVP